MFRKTNSSCYLSTRYTSSDMEVTLAIVLDLIICAALSCVKVTSMNRCLTEATIFSLRSHFTGVTMTGEFTDLLIMSLTVA